MHSGPCDNLWVMQSRKTCVLQVGVNIFQCSWAVFGLAERLLACSLWTSWVDTLQPCAFCTFALLRGPCTPGLEWTCSMLGQLLGRENNSCPSRRGFIRGGVRSFCGHGVAQTCLAVTYALYMRYTGPTICRLRVLLDNLHVHSKEG